MTAYPHDSKDWLQRWDRGELVWSVGMTHGHHVHERIIQTLTAEIVRYLFIRNPQWSNAEEWKIVYDVLREHFYLSDVLASLSPTDAQWTAAVNLAVALHRQTPPVVFSDPRVKHQLIQVRKHE